ncbi:ras guanine nucleotide exchange factor domain-containing protein [Chytriomyces cf. hyalinus JEL632]|nr:ras guanine nucleotide exchange factor domain-containing protein [Chytriomyces cf. hyalinus JEL632]
MKSLKKAPALQERDSTVSMRSSFLTAIGKRRNIRDSHASRDARKSENQASVDQNASETCVSGILDYCQDGNADPIKKLLSTRTAIVKLLQTLNSNIDVYGNTCLHVAVAHNDYVLATVLLVRGADPNRCNRSGISPLILSLRLFGSVSKLSQLLLVHAGKEAVRGESQEEGFIPSETSTPDSVKKKNAKPISLVLTFNKDPPSTTPSTSPVVDTSKAYTSLTLTSSQVLIRFQQIVPRAPFSANAAAFLDLKISYTPDHFLSSQTKSGTTPLMKAAFKGNLDFIRQHLGTRYHPSIDQIDHRGFTALCYACISGHVATVQYLVEICGARIEGADSVDIHPWTEEVVPRPLMLASFSGAASVAQYLVKSGADVNARVGGCTALMVACWMRRFDVVQVLVGARAVYDKEMGDWVRSGLRKLRRMSGVFWSEDMDLQGWRLVSLVKREGLRKDASLLSSEDMEDAARIISILKADQPVVALTQEVTEVDDGVVFDFDQITEQGGEARFQTIDLTEKLPTRGTELDESFLQVFKCVILLAMAANKHDKATYVVIAAKQIRQSSTLLSLIDCMRAADRSSKDYCVPISPHYSKCYSNRLFETSLFANTAHSKVIKDQICAVKATQEALMFATKMACGIWPPANALTEMIQAASQLSKACRLLTELANLTGFYPVLEKALVLKLDSVNENRTSADIEISLLQHNEFESTSKGWPRPNQLTFQKYTQLNGLRNVESLSKSIAASTAPDPPECQQQPLSADADTKYFASLEQSLRRFVVAVNDLKKLQTQKLRDRYIPATKLISERSNQIIEEIQGFDLFVDFAESFDSVILEECDVVAMEATGVTLQITNFPAPALLILDLVQQEVVEAAARVEDIGREASFIWATVETERKMIESCIPCVMAIKKLFSVAKTVAQKIRSCWEGDVQRQLEWKRKTTQNEKVQALFQAWSGGASEASKERVDISKLNLDDDISGIVFDPKLGGLKGGKLDKIIELITSHNNFDLDMAQTLLMCHHSFSTSVELLKSLCARYECMLPPPNLNEREFQTWFEVKCKPVQQNVLKVFGIWLNLYLQEDFVMNELLSSNLRFFIETTVSEDWESHAKTLLGTMDSKTQATGVTPSTSSKHISRAYLPKGIINIFSLGVDPSAVFSDATRILEVDALEFAKQLTLFEFDEFALVRPSECLDQIWSANIEKERAAAKLQVLTKKQTSCKHQSKEYSSPSESAISKMIGHTNKLSLWIATTILSCANIKIRVLLLRYFAQCAIKCRELSNYNGITGIVAGLSMAPIARLHKTWRKFGKYYSSILSDYEASASIVSPKGQYANYRKELKDIKLPAIPFLGVYLTDITFIDLGNPELLPCQSPNPSRSDRIINFDKCRKIASVIKEIQKFQAVQFVHAPVDWMQDFFGRIGEVDALFNAGAVTAVVMEQNLGLAVGNEDGLYTQSLVVEPREEEDDDESDGAE